MARIQTHTVPLPSGRLLIFDPVALFGAEETNKINGLVKFESPYVSKDGHYKVYRDGQTHFVDLHPQTFRANKRPELERKNETIYVDTCTVGFVDLSNSTLLADPSKDDQGFCVLDYPPGEIQVWFEQKEGNVFRGVVGIGPTPRMVVNGSDAASVAELEKRSILVFRKKAGWREIKEDLKTEILKMHFAGCNDARFKTLASSLQIDLPRRPRKKKS
ncbi:MULTISPECIES: hypothetical protein [unclassified Lentimonas]|uniref:hypothetical protein n=1 Tax=unclassified Lentimonas TaxID=2630993 RepID=UPI0013291012|nr:MULTISPECIES: hypothetical protein [unclassified Lentimonas]CAA6693470.1 Unannotated [Lentimonas sp. CC19]CAA6695820.1 Unannotated [Lentimonas sp. CC10]CAA7069741.1 Unannotated [Lentimonas sp. CC11]